MNTIFWVVDDIADVITAGYTVIRIYRDTSESGAFAAVLATVALVAGTESYTYVDVTGTTAHWYRSSFYDAGVTESTLSAARKSDTSSSYATVEETRNNVKITKQSDDVELAFLLDAASAAIDNFTLRPEGYQAVQTAAVRYYTGKGESYIYIDEYVEVTAVAVKDSPSDDTYTAWTAPTTDFAGDGDWIPFAGSHEVRPDFNPIIKGKPFTGLMVDPNGDQSVFTTGRYSARAGFRPHAILHRAVPTVQVTARWGYADVIPYPIKLACMMQAVRWYQRLHGGMADSLANPELGQVSYVRTLDPDVKHLLVAGRFMKRALG